MLDPPYDRPLEPIASDPLAGLIDALTARREEVIEKGLHRIRTEIPEYRAIVDPAFVEDVRQHVALHHDALMRSVAARRPLSREELSFMRTRATRRVGRIPLAAFMQAFRIYQEEFWDALLASADSEAARISAMEAAGTIIRYINVAPRPPRSTSRPSASCTPRASAYGATCSRTCSPVEHQRRARSSPRRAQPGWSRAPSAS